ncbi:DUF2878 domain-containing protein [Burkholderia lata]|uniref:DUF2878 domain-containing protein n=1 Tax=Burkholderia lata (strain ATCC 17760 / DSM 23089 / LMG 22485 / NCIMB 9086 / R18194 / 383) TaxID=482957 RepID=UPI00399B0BD3
MSDSTMAAFVDLRSVGYRALICVLLFGLGLFSFGDHFYHVRNHVVSYNVGPFVDGQSMLVWLIFVAAAALIYVVTYAFARDATPPSLSLLLWQFVLMHAGYLSSGIWGISHSTELTLGLAAVWVVRIAFTSQYRGKIVAISLLLAVLGAVGEGIVSMSGFFDYAPTLKQIVGVPYWLICLYLNGGPLAFTAARWVRTGVFSHANPAGLTHKKQV